MRPLGHVQARHVEVYGAEIELMGREHGHRTAGRGLGYVPRTIDRFPRERREEISNANLARIDLHVVDRRTRLRDGARAAKFLYEI